MKKGFLVGVCAALVFVMLAPQYASAVEYEGVTEIANFQPATDDNDEVRNVANETIKTNIDSWNPRPEGIFVGGVIEESLIRLNEIGTGASNYLRISTKMHFQPGYLSSGASMFVVRLPIYVSEDPLYTPVDLDLKFFEMSPTDTYWMDFSAGSVPWEDGIDLNTTGKLVAYMENLANLRAYADSPTTESIWRGITTESWLSDGRVYARLIAPILTDRDYILTMEAEYLPSAPFDIYWQPADLCSDEIQESRVAYKWPLDAFTYLFRDYPVEVDAGWSFVFQQGIGGLASMYDAYYAAGSDIFFWQYVETETEIVSGNITFLMEFRVDYATELNWTLSVDWYNMTTGTHQTVLSSSYWDLMSDRYFIMAGGDVASSSGIEVEGSWYQVFLVHLTINNATRMQMMTCYEPDLPGFNVLCVGGPTPYLMVMPNRFYTVDPSGVLSNVFFSPWCSILIADYTYNISTATPAAQPTGSSGFWDGIGNWWDEHWVDVLGVIMIIGGVALILTGVGAGFGVALIAAGIGVLLYDNVDWIHDAVDNFISSVIDGLLWLGNWLWKIGQMIWKAITWFIDALVNSGSTILAILIYALAVLCPIIIIMISVKALSIMLKIAKGDLEGAAADAREVIKTVSDAIPGGD